MNTFKASIILFIGFLAYYIALLHTDMIHSHDSITYYNRIISGNYAWHSHHILYEPFSYLWYSLLKNVIFIHSFKLISLMNCVFTAGNIVIIFNILVSILNIDLKKSLIITVGIGGSFYFLNYATTVEVCHPALFFMLLTIYLLQHSSRLTFKLAILGGVCHGIAIGFHQMHILLGLVILWYFFKEKKFKEFTIYSISALIITSLIYGIGFIAEGHVNFIEFFLGYLDREHIVKETTSPLFAPVGFILSIIGGRYILSLEYIQSLIVKYYSGDNYAHFYELHENSLMAFNWIQNISYLVFTVTSVIILKNFFKSDIKKILCNQSFYLGIIFIYSLFFTFWFPHNPEFWGVQLIFLFCLIVPATYNNLQLIAFSGSIILINLFGTGIPLVLKSTIS